MLAEVIEERLTEWARWARAYGRRRRCAELAEGRYRSPQRDHWTEQAPPVRLAPIVAQRAYEVELAVAMLPAPSRAAIVMRYVYRLPEIGMRRRLRRWNVRDVQPGLDEARQRVAEALTRGTLPHVVGLLSVPFTHRGAGESMA